MSVLGKRKEIVRSSSYQAQINIAPLLGWFSLGLTIVFALILSVILLMLVRGYVTSWSTEIWFVKISIQLYVNLLFGLFFLGYLFVFLLLTRFGRVALSGYLTVYLLVPLFQPYISRLNLSLFEINVILLSLFVASLYISYILLQQLDQFLGLLTSEVLMAVGIGVVGSALVGSLFMGIWIFARLPMNI